MKQIDPQKLEISEAVCVLLVSKLGILRYFPGDDSAREAVVDLLMSMCEYEWQASWLIRRITSGIYNEWPGIQEMRACYCARFQPKDGISIGSAIYPDQFPPDPTMPKLLAAPDPFALWKQQAEPVTDEERAAWNHEWAHLNERKAAPPAMAQPSTSSRMPADCKPITQADVDRAVAENRRKE